MGFWGGNNLSAEGLRVTRWEKASQEVGIMKVKRRDRQVASSREDTLQPSCAVICSQAQRHVLRRMDANYKVLWVPRDAMELPRQPQRCCVQTPCTQGKGSISAWLLGISVSYIGT